MSDRNVAPVGGADEGLALLAEAEEQARNEDGAVDARTRRDYPSYRVEPGQNFSLRDLDPEESEGYQSEHDIFSALEIQRERIADWQERLFAEEEQSLLIVLQAMDAGGKDGVGRGVLTGLDPQGCNIWSFKQASKEEEKHDFLWRFHQKVPEAGVIGVFNRSYYEAVLADRVNERVPEEVWRARYDQMNEFERILTQNKVKVVKLFLHMSRDEQKRRLQERLVIPNKQYLFSINDVKEREKWDDYQQAFEDMLNRCSTEYAPWYAIPANRKWFRNLAVARIIADTLEEMNPQYPPLDEECEGVEIPD